MPDPKDRKTNPDEEQVTGIGAAAIEGAVEGEQEQTSSPDSTKPETSHAGMSDPRSRTNESSASA